MISYTGAGGVDGVDVVEGVLITGGVGVDVVCCCGGCDGVLILVDRAGACVLVAGGSVGLLVDFPAVGLLDAAADIWFAVGAGADELPSVGLLTVFVSVSAGTVDSDGSSVGSDMTVDAGVPDTSALVSVVLFAAHAAIVSVRMTAMSNNIGFFKHNSIPNILPKSS